MGRSVVADGSARVLGVAVRPGRGWRVGWGVVVAALGVLLLLAVRPSGALASANVNWATGVKATLPADAGSNPSVNLNSMSCPSAGNCSAVGSYQDTQAAQLWNCGT